MLTLGIVPVVYSLLDDLRNRLWKPVKFDGEAPVAPRPAAAAER